MSSTRKHPYQGLPAKAFWRETIAAHHPLEIPDWYRQKWPIADSRIATAGSCFAQHIGRHLRHSGFQFLDVEPAPPALKTEHHADFSYGQYSARYGNVYTTRQLLQLLRQALGEFQPADRAWAKGGGFVDPFRPTIEPEPMGSIDEVEACRRQHLAAVARLFEQTDVFVFTLGLTEAWVSAKDGAVFPVCPGVSGGEFDPARHKFTNFGFPEVLADLTAFIQLARSIRNSMRFLLTVSPVPLAATATRQQVAVATSYSKSVLRAVAGHLAERHQPVDYFPSYEIVASPAMRGSFFAPDGRSVIGAGVAHVMAHFFQQHSPPKAATSAAAQPDAAQAAAERLADDIACDEALLAAFGGSRP